VGTGEKLDDLDEFYPDRMASRILGMGDMLSLIERVENIRKPFAGAGKITVFDHTLIATDADLSVCAALYTGELGLHGPACGARFTLRSDCIALRKGGRPAIVHMAMRAHS
ncbi:MAG TPA: hypothetical protein PKE04_18890, partial [Clostridia bacterium]|nr:hypothetical protein [Clostridia bacterium]